MYKGKRFLVVIPARGGSKGIPRKNIYNVAGKPLIAYTIEAAKQSKYIDRIVVSTDDQEIADISQIFGAEVPFLRPRELATDDAITIDAVLHMIGSLKEKYDYVLTLQPTQPLRTSIHIDQAVETIIEKSYRSLVSVSPVKEHPILMRTVDSNGLLHSLLPINSTVRRQDFIPFYRVDGVIYINQTSELNRETSLNDNEGAYIIREMMIDVDEFVDLKRVEEKLKSN